MAIGQTITEISRFFNFQHGGRPPSWICYVHVWTTPDEYLVVFITVQNLAGINAVVLIICKRWYSLCLAWKCPFTPQMEFFWRILSPKWGAVISRPPKGTCLCRSTSYDIQIVMFSPPVFEGLTAQHPYILHWAAPFPPQNCPSMGIWTPSNTWFLGPICAHNPNGISVGSSLFAGLTTVTDRPTHHAILGL